jgi:hypothetical protein
LRTVLIRYKGITPNLRQLSFKSPFKPFIHRWTEFSRAIDEESDGETKKHAQLLHRTLEAELKDVLEAKKDYVANGVITFEHLFTLFSPGATIYTREWGRDCASEFCRGYYCTDYDFGKCFVVATRKVNWNGSSFGFENSFYYLPTFVGAMRIEDLNAFPIEFHPDCENVKRQLVERGKIFEQYCGYQYKAYKGPALRRKHSDETIKVTIESRIVIDTAAYDEYNPDLLPILDDFSTKPTAADMATQYYSDSDQEYEPAPLALRRPSPGRRRSRSPVPVPRTFQRRQNRRGRHANEQSTGGKALARIKLSEDQLLHASPLTHGYAFRTRQWLSFFVDQASDIIFNENAFSSLVLPAEKKEMILAFASSQVKYKDSFDDVISGKGKGMTMLLSGGPGTGKTLTAESVAEDLKVPLYTLSMNELGFRSYDMESKLITVLDMVARWNAVLLLDECDVFLEARSRYDDVMSIFLRTLEYYEGILFLTSNRVEDMDPAFRSRIHLSLTYPELDSVSRHQVWKNLLRDKEHNLSDKELEILALVDINGRQIKNILKAGGLLARFSGQKLGYEHLKRILNGEK